MEGPESATGQKLLADDCSAFRVFPGHRATD